MRLAGQAKSGFYPIAPEVIDLIVPHLLAPSEPWTLLDPCIGKGEALNQLATSLQCPKVYGIELDEGRIEEARALNWATEPTLLGPCDALSARITSKSIGLAYVNPPFDVALGGTRAEVKFLYRATGVLAVDGVLVYILPETAYYHCEPVFRTCYKNVKVVPFPSEHRKFREIAVFGIRRRHNLDLKDSPALVNTTWDEIGTYDIPSTEGPRSFEKTALTEPEIELAMQRSPLNRLFDAAPPKKLARPPLPLGKGHTSLLLASGQLDGVVEKDGVKHVVRGSTRKETYTRDESETVDGDGNVTRKWVEAERMIPLIRTAWSDGRIETHE